MNRLLRAVCSGLLLVVSVAAVAGPADYVWLERDAESARAYLGELGRERLPPAGLLSPRATLADGKALPLEAGADRYAIAVGAGGDLRFVASRAAGDGSLSYFQAKAGRSETKAVNDLELVPTTPGGNTFKLIWKGGSVAASQVNVMTSAGWSRTLKPTGSDGTVTLDTPFPGLYLLAVTVRVNGDVTVDGKKYEDVRHTATLSFEVKS